MKKVKKFMNIKKVRIIQVLKEYWGVDDWIALMIFIFGICYFFFGISDYHKNKFFLIYNDIHAELIGIGITVLILGNADEYIRKKIEKRRLILSMGSDDNRIALEAVRVLSICNWLYDGTLTYVNLIEANLKRARLTCANLDHADLRIANLENADLRDAILTGCALNGAKLNDANFERAHLERADFYGATLIMTSFGHAYLNNASFIKTDMHGADFFEAHLENVCMVSNNMKQVDFSYTHMEKAILNGQNLQGVTFNEAHLEGALLSNTNLIGVDLHNVIFNSKTCLEGAKYSLDTQWPDGFDPEAHGCILVK